MPRLPCPALTTACPAVTTAPPLPLPAGDGTYYQGGGMEVCAGPYPMMKSMLGNKVDHTAVSAYTHEPFKASCCWGAAARLAPVGFVGSWVLQGLPHLACPYLPCMLTVERHPLWGAAHAAGPASGSPHCPPALDWWVPCRPSLLPLLPLTAAPHCCPCCPCCPCCLLVQVYEFDLAILQAFPKPQANGTTSVWRRNLTAAVASCYDCYCCLCPHKAA